MQDYNLIDPGYEAAGRTLRKHAAHVISNAELDTNPDPRLALFFSDCASKTPGYAGPSLPATQALVSNGGNVNVKNSAGTVTKVGVATVAANAISGVALPATSAIVDSGSAPVMQNSAGTAIPGTSVRTVAAGAESNIKLPATVAPVVNGVKINAVSVTGTGNFATITVANGVITAIVLSAS